MSRHRVSEGHSPSRPMIGDAERVRELERENAELRERARTAELAAAWTADKEEMSDALAEAERARDEALVKLYAAEERLARYEAPGPALLVAGHNGPCTEWYRRSGVRRCRSHDCDAEIRQEAHEYQHARCVAVVERELAKSAAAAQQQPTPYWRGGEDAVRNVLTALTGEKT